ncbi:uncharacterized protein LOC131328330 [Rhododendron vialii]|uniref:uncharacterized protein LOC131328330 n=1 Tax=Rhododendron vialii TaxID=182163 RepID=UPI00265DAB2F|nr:uncharacterized protein LOC131328330 [Rhododendron vialii]
MTFKRTITSGKWFFSSSRFGLKETVLVVGLFKLNTDGSFDANLSMGLAGGLICESSGNWVLGFQRKDVVASSSTAIECWALKDGLQLALERNLIGILVETDSLTLVHVLNQIVLKTMSYVILCLTAWCCWTSLK